MTRLGLFLIKMKKLLPHLLLALLVVGCASRSNVKTTNITMTLVDGKINSGTTTLKIEDIIKDCKKECATFTISSDEWCNCMDICFDMDEGASHCPTDSTNTN